MALYSFQLAATTTVSSVIGVTVGATFLLLCNSALPVRNVWATTDHAPRGITTIMLRVTEALAVFTLYRLLGSLISFNCHSLTTERRQSTHIADKWPASDRHYEVRCWEPVICRIGMEALRAEPQLRLNQNSGDFQLLPDILLGHVLAETLDQESSAPDLRQVWKATPLLASVDLCTLTVALKQLAVLGTRTSLSPCILALPSLPVSSVNHFKNSLTSTTPVTKRGFFFILSPIAVSYSIGLDYLFYGKNFIRISFYGNHIVNWLQDYNSRPRL